MRYGAEGLAYNIKTAHTCFKTGVTVYDKEPTFKSDMLVYEGRYYTGLSTVKKDISAMEANLAKPEQQEQKYTDELNAALAEYNELKAQAADFDPDELAMAQLAIRPQMEASAESCVQVAYGDKFDFWTMISAKRDVAELLGEEEPRSIRERLRRKEIEKQRISREREPQRKKSKDHGWER